MPNYDYKLVSISAKLPTFNLNPIIVQATASFTKPTISWRMQI